MVTVDKFSCTYKRQAKNNTHLCPLGYLIETSLFSGENKVKFVMLLTLDIPRRNVA